MESTSSNTDLHGYGEEIRKELGKRIPRDKKLNVLDVGTGFGINVAFLARWLAKGSVVWTVDPSQEVLVNVKAALDSKISHVVRFGVASADDLDFGDGSFDVVVSVMVLHHIEKLQPALREMSRVMKPGGKLVIVDYKPEASQKLKFTTRHEESDFLSLPAVVREIEGLGMMIMGSPSDFGVWYLVEAHKKKTMKGKTRTHSNALRDGLARARSGR
jgi:ubiquinone/menaquinone biosynthesis C-methylase UbiE